MYISMTIKVSVFTVHCAVHDCQKEQLPFVMDVIIKNNLYNSYNTYNNDNTK